MRIYIIGNDGITLCRETPPPSMAARLRSRKKRNCTLRRSAASGCWRCGTLCPVSKRGARSATAGP